MPSTTGERMVLFNSTEPAPVMGMQGVRFSSISVGLQHVCGIEDGSARIMCWGVSRLAQCMGGLWGTMCGWLPSASRSCACAVATLPSQPCLAYLWQENAKGALGRGSRSNAVIDPPTDASPGYISVPADVQFAEVHASNEFTYARARDSVWWCWGSECCAGCSMPAAGRGWTRTCAKPLRARAWPAPSNVPHPLPASCSSK